MTQAKKRQDAHYNMGITKIVQATRLIEDEISSFETLGQVSSWVVEYIMPRLQENATSTSDCSEKAEHEIDGSDDSTEGRSSDEDDTMSPGPPDNLTKHGESPQAHDGKEDILARESPKEVSKERKSDGRTPTHEYCSSHREETKDAQFIARSALHAGSESMRKHHDAKATITKTSNHGHLRSIMPQASLQPPPQSPSRKPQKEESIRHKNTGRGVISHSRDSPITPSTTSPTTSALKTTSSRRRAQSVKRKLSFSGSGKTKRDPMVIE